MRSHHHCIILAAQTKGWDIINERIYIVDDEMEIADLIALYLQNDSYRVETFGDGASALARIEKQPPDLGILDIMLPDMDGFQICSRIREHHFFPVIMLTAKTEDNDKILGLTIGADDYITKPFNPLELIARVKTQLRRYVRYNPAESGAPGASQNGTPGTLQKGAKDASEANLVEYDIQAWEFYVVHDLKTPLTSVIGYLSLLRDKPQISRELREKYLAISLDKSERLEDLINEFSRSPISILPVSSYSIPASI